MTHPFQVTVRKIHESEFYSVRVAGTKMAEVRYIRDKTSWDWNEAYLAGHSFIRNMSDDDLDTLVEAIHLALGTTE